MHRLAVSHVFAAISSFTRRTSSRRGTVAWPLTLSLALPLALLMGCGMGPNLGSPVAAKLDYQGKVQGGQQPVTGSLIQLYAAGTTGDGSSATPLISAVVTTSDGTGNSANSNANAGNGFNALPAGSFNITGTYTCPSPSAQVYLVATGGNPGLAPGMSNPFLAMMAALGRCGDLTPTSSVFINELTTVGSIAPLAQYMGGYASLGSSPANATQLLAAMNLVRQYTNTGNGTVPGPDLQPGYYASQLEATTLSNILAACVNSSGSEACTELFRLTTPPGGGVPPTDTIGAAINVIKYPTNNTTAIYNLLPATAPFQPTLPAAPAAWSLPIVPVAATPVISPAGGAYSVAPTVTITTASAGATIRYTTDGSTPTAASPVYTAPFTLPASGTVRAFASGAGFATSAVASATYTLPPAGTATQLIFVTQPGNPAVGFTVPSVRVGIADAYGTLVPVTGVTLTAALAANPGSATLGGTRTAVTSQDGSITFSTLTMSAAGTGYTLTISAPGYASVTSAPFTVYPYGITLTQASQVVGTGKTMAGKVTLGGAAPVGGTVVGLGVSDTSIVSVAPSTITIPEGSTTGNYVITGVAPGQTVLTASAPNYASQSLTQFDSASFVTFGTIAAVTPGVTVTTTLSLSAPAPVGGLSVSLASSNTGSATITPATVTFAAGATTSATTLTIVGRGYGSTDLSAVPASASFGGETRTISTGTNSATLTATLAVPVSGAATDTLTLASPAPTGGLTFSITATPSGVVSIPSTVFVAAGATTATFSVSATRVGTATITATASGITSTSTTATVAGALYYTPGASGVGVDILTVVSMSTAPVNPVTVTITSSNPNVLLLSASTTSPGVPSLTFNNVSVTAVNFYTQGVAAGTADVTITATGYASVTATSTVYRPAVKFYNPGCCGGNTTSGPLTTQMSIYLNNSAGTTNVADCLGSCTVSPGAGFSVNVASTNTNIVTVQSPVVFAVGTTFATLTYTPVGAGTAKMQMTSTPAGFYDRTGLTYAASVNIGQSTFHSPGVSQFTTGAGVYIANNESLDYTPSSPLTVTVSTGNPAIAVVSSSASAAGAQTITFPNITGTIPTVYLQGLQAGTTTLTYSAPGVADLTTTVNVNPAGVVFYSVNPLTLNTANTLTGTLSVGLAIYTSSGSGVLQYCYVNSTAVCAPNPTTNTSTTLASSNTAVGSIAPNPVTLLATSTNTATFTAAAAGTTTVSIGSQIAPLSNNLSTAVSQVSVTVTQPTITLSLPSTVGASVYSAASASLSPSPSSARTMTLTVTDPTIALLSTTATSLGSASISFTGVTSGSKTYYIQGLQAGTTTVKISAPGYTDGTATLTVLPSGIVFATGTSSFTTTAFATARTLPIYLALLSPTTGALQTICNSSCFANPGSSLSIPVVSSNPGIGTISASPVTFAAGTSTATTTFVPNDVGQTTIALGTQPIGLSTSTTASTVSGVATVTGDYIDVSSTIVGEGVYTYKYLTLPSSPGSYPVTVTVALADQSMGRLSTSETTLGTSGSLTFTLNSGITIGMIYIQGVASGNTTLLMSARGYNTGRGAVQVMKTGITFLSSNAVGLDVNLSSGNTNASTGGLVSLLDPVSLAWISDCQTMIFACKVNPGHSTAVTFGTVDSSVASFSTTPVSIDTSTSLVMAPITVGAAGVTDFGITQQPAGWYSTSTPHRSTGRIVVGDTTHLVSRDVDTAVGMQVQTAFTLSATNYASLSATFTATVADPTVAVLSTAFGTAGGSSVSAYGTGALGFTFYVQGKTDGTTTITFAGGGYTPRTVTVRVRPGGFVLKGPDVFRKLTSGNLSVLITPAVLNASQQWIADAVTNPGSSINIPMTSSDPSIGTIVTSPVALTGAVSGVNALFHPVTVGTTVLSVGTPSGFAAPTSYGTMNATVQ